MKRTNIVLMLLSLPILLMAQLSVVSDKSYDFGKDSKISGIDAVVVFEGIDTLAQLKYVFTDSSEVEWHYHTVLSDSLIVDSAVKDTVSYIGDLEQGLYEMKVKNSPSQYFYVVDFSKYQSVIDSVWVDDNKYDCCKSIVLNATINLEEIPVYDKLNDTTCLLVEPETDFMWLMDTAQMQADGVNKIDAPFEDIIYACIPHSADFFDNELSVLYSEVDTAFADYYTAVAISKPTFTYTIPEEEEGYLSNEMIESTPVKGSAPLEVNYEVEYKGNVDYSAWWVWKAVDKQPNSPTYRNQDHIFYTFEKFVAEPGYRVKFVLSNDSCSVTDSVDVMVTESKLEVPNVLVLGWGAVGVFKVAYQSIDPSSFIGAIYDRKGRLVFKWKDPEQGWDGRVGGGYASPGAYYYSIRARGTDGEKYELAGDVSVVREKGIK